MNGAMEVDTAAEVTAVAMEEDSNFDLEARRPPPPSFD
jgi:hypothetical protein